MPGEITATHAADAIAARDQVAFPVRLMRTADEMLGTLLDVRA